MEFVYLGERRHGQQRVERYWMVFEVRESVQRFNTAHLPFRTAEETSGFTGAHPHHPPGNDKTSINRGFQVGPSPSPVVRMSVSVVGMNNAAMEAYIHLILRYRQTENDDVVWRYLKANSNTDPPLSLHTARVGSSVNCRTRNYLTSRM